jgi:hypothetical protein
VYAGDVEEVDGGAAASIGNLAGHASDAQHPVQPVDAPPSANAAAGTVDFYYVLDNQAAHYRPGHRVAVSVALKSDAMSLVAPWSAIVHDIHGGTWLYEEAALGLGTFSRRRVTVRFVINGQAVLATGPAPGTKVVEAGAAELFGTETGFTK